MRSRVAALAVAVLIVPASIGLAAETDGRPWLGAGFGRALSWDNEPIVIVGAVLPGSPVDRAGLLKDDFLKAINGGPVSDPADVTRFLDGARAGQVVVLTIARGHDVIALTMSLEVPTDDDRQALRELIDTTDPGSGPVFIPQQLCIVGVTWSEAAAMAVIPGTVTMDLDKAQECRHPVQACSVLKLERQSKRKTVVSSRGVSYSLKGDWSGITFTTRDDCLRAISGSAPPEQGSQK